MGKREEMPPATGDGRLRGWETGTRLVCVRCGTTVDLETDPIVEYAESAANNAGFQLQSYRLDLWGLCEECEPRDSRCVV